MSRAGLYDDARFPGRCLLVLNQHEEDLTALEGRLLIDYMADLRDLSAALRTVTGAQRLNVAVLGNAVPHVHWHVVPRIPEFEPLPDRSPWSDPRPRHRLPPDRLAWLTKALQRELPAGFPPADPALSCRASEP